MLLLKQNFMKLITKLIVGLIGGISVDRLLGTEETGSQVDLFFREHCRVKGVVDHKEVITSCT